MIEVSELTKVFPTTDGGEKRAVDGLSFRVEPGEIFGLLGPNGAGKTTTLRMIGGLLAPTSGTARLNGQDIRAQREAAKRFLGYLTAGTGLYHRLSPREMLRYFGELVGMDRAAIDRRMEVLVDWLDMREFADLRCGGLSTGQRQRTNIARALMGDPPILIMDEPTLGLDVLTNRIVLDFIRAEGARGKAIILSTHYLDDAETVCGRFGLLHEGRLIGEGDLEAMREKTGVRRLSEIFLKLCGQEQHVLRDAVSSQRSGFSQALDAGS
ncbi:MAG TPA: ABC transporter ATP-binding protein [Phycisphaerae bacterium]|nr:ABC transporter ATP-binding protein [Phycisphaerae bacterium]